MEEQEESMTKDEMQRFLIKEAKRGTDELEAYRNLLKILGIGYPKKESKARKESHASSPFSYAVITALILMPSRASSWRA